MGGFKGHQTLTSCCDLIIDHREKLLKTFLLGAASSTSLWKENLKNSHIGNTSFFAEPTLTYCENRK